MDFISTLPGWAINAITIGLLGGIAGLVGGLVSKAGMSWGRFVPIVGIVVGLALANNGLADWVRTATLTPERVGAMMKAASPQLLGFIEANFPEDYALLSARITDLIKSGGDEAEASMQSALASAEIRRKYAPLIGRASDRDQAAFIDLSIEFYQALLDTDPMLCNAVAASGPTALLDRPGVDHLQAMVEPQGVALLQAAVNAMSAPAERRAATAADWLELSGAMYARGATDAQFAALNVLDRTSPDLCPGVIMLLQTLNAIDSEGIKAVRAQYLADYAAS